MGRQMDDLLRKRIYDVVSKPRSADVAVGEWLDPEVGSPYELAHRHLNGGTRCDGSSDDGDRTVAARLRDSAGAVSHHRTLELEEGPLAELLRQIDLREAGDAAIAPSTHRWDAASDGLVREWTRVELSGREQLSTFVSDHLECTIELRARSTPRICWSFGDISVGASLVDDSVGIRHRCGGQREAIAVHDRALYQN